MKPKTPNIQFETLPTPSSHLRPRHFLSCHRHPGLSTITVSTTVSFTFTSSPSSNPPITVDHHRMNSSPPQFSILVVGGGVALNWCEGCGVVVEFKTLAPSKALETPRETLLVNLRFIRCEFQSRFWNPDGVDLKLGVLLYWSLL
ncbi:hypothetical protein Droror1_Dr00012163 [Drosera rotundifolia]